MQVDITTSLNTKIIAEPDVTVDNKVLDDKSQSVMRREFASMS